MMEEEIWKDIEGYEGLYQVSSFGRVKSLSRLVIRASRGSFIKKETISKQNYNRNGYLLVPLFSNGSQIRFQAHRLVAMAFIPNPKNKPCINHINNIRDSNHVENLEWVTHSENMLYAIACGNWKPPMTGRFGADCSNSKKVFQYDLLLNYISEYGSETCASKATGVGISGISLCCKGGVKTAGGYVWRHKRIDDEDN